MLTRRASCGLCLASLALRDVVLGDYRPYIHSTSSGTYQRLKSAAAYDDIGEQQACPAQSIRLHCARPFEQPGPRVWNMSGCSSAGARAKGGSVADIDRAPQRVQIPKGIGRESDLGTGIHEILRFGDPTLARHRGDLADLAQHESWSGVRCRMREALDKDR